jgi:hypothetical protein
LGAFLASKFLLELVRLGDADTAMLLLHPVMKTVPQKIEKTVLEK